MGVLVQILPQEQNWPICHSHHKQPCFLMGAKTVDSRGRNVREMTALRIRDSVSIVLNNKSYRVWEVFEVTDSVFDIMFKFWGENCHVRSIKIYLFANTRILTKFVHNIHIAYFKMCSLFRIQI